MEYISVPEWARLHRVTREHAARLARDGKLKTATKIGRNYVIDKDDVLPEDGRIEHCKNMKKK